MPYFFILPAFGLYVIGMVVAVILTSLYRPLAGARPYILSVFVWSSLGFVASTVLYFVAVVAIVSAMTLVPEPGGSVIGGMAMGGLVFLVPFVAAFVGLVGGGAFGAWRAWTNRERRGLTIA